MGSLIDADKVIVADLRHCERLAKHNGDDAIAKIFADARLEIERLRGELRASINREKIANDE